MSTHNIPFFNRKKKNTLNYPKSAAMRFFSKGLKNEFERAVVNEHSVFEPLKFYCTWFALYSLNSQYDTTLTKHYFSDVNSVVCFGNKGLELQTFDMNSHLP